MRCKSHVGFGGRARETYRLKGRHRALVRPHWHVLEDRGFELFLVNATHVRKVPGRKTDVKDAEWIAQLLECGLLRGSFVPPEVIRDLRDLTRYRKRLGQDRARESQRIQKVLEDAGVKLASVVSDILGVSGRAMLDALIAGERDADVLAELALGRMRPKRVELRRALRRLGSVPTTPSCSASIARTSTTSTAPSTASTIRSTG